MLLLRTNELRQLNFSSFSAGQDCGACKTGQVSCQVQNGASKCINRTSVCDREYDCPAGDDEMNCNLDFSQFFNCSDGSKYIQGFRRCDGKYKISSMIKIFCLKTFFKIVELILVIFLHILVSFFDETYCY